MRIFFMCRVRSIGYPAFLSLNSHTARRDGPITARKLGQTGMVMPFATMVTPVMMRRRCPAATAKRNRDVTTDAGLFMASPGEKILYAVKYFSL
jgi:hypothetical protein